MNCETCMYFNQQNKSLTKGLCSYKSIVRDRYIFTHSYKSCKSYRDIMDATPAEIQLDNDEFNNFLEEKREEKFWREQ